MIRDIHSNKETVTNALYDLEQSIKLCKKQHDKVLMLIVGYGSNSGHHRIKTAVLEKLKEYKDKNFVKDYIEGSKLDIFDLEYQKFKYKELISDEEKRRKNPGIIYIIC